MNTHSTLGTTMTPQHVEALKLLIALQVALLEHDNSPSKQIQRALQIRYAQLGRALKELK